MKTGKVILTLMLSSLLMGQAVAQQSMLSIGVHGGGQLWLPKAGDASTVAHGSIGGLGMLDFRYAYYGDVGGSAEIGLTTGIGAGFGNAGIQGTNTSTFSNIDYLGNQIDYTTHATFKQIETFVRLEASLMMALRVGGFVANIGPRFMLPFATSQTLTITEANIEAHYPRYNVTIANELITGRLQTPYNQSVTPNLPMCNILLGIEAGWEWPMDNNALGVQAYANIGLWNNSTPSTSSVLLSVAPITEADSPAAVHVNNAEELVDNRRMLDFGIRAYYTFSVGKTTAKYRGRRISSRRDTRKHRNRFMYQ